MPEAHKYSWRLSILCRFPFVLLLEACIRAVRGSGEAGAFANGTFIVSLGDRWRWRADDMRRHRRHVLAGRLSAADVVGNRMVARRNIGRNDYRFPDHGNCGLRLGERQR